MKSYYYLIYIIISGDPLIPKLGMLFFYFQCATSAGLLTANVLRISIAWWCLEETNSAIIFASIISLSVACEIYLSPFLSSFGDHFPRLKMILCSQVVITLMMLSTLAMKMQGEFNAYVLTSVLIIISVIVSFRDPTIGGVIPDLVAKHEVSAAISRRSQINAIFNFIGPITAASIISYLGITKTFVFASFLSFVSSFFYFLVWKRCAIDFDSGKAEVLQRFNWFVKTKEGFGAIIKVKNELYVAFVSAVVNFTMFPFFTIVIPFWINQVLQLPASYLGMFEGAFGIGLIAGSSWFIHLFNGFCGRLYTVAAGFIFLGFSILLMVMINHQYITLLLSFICGIAFMLININLNTLRASATPANYRVRMNAIASFLSRITNPLAIFVSGLGIKFYGVHNVVLASGMIMILIVPMMLLSEHVRNALSLSNDEMDGYYEKKYPGAFK